MLNHQNSTISGLVCAEISDHMPIFHIQKSDAESEVKKTPDSYFKSKCFNNNNILFFKNTVSQKDWNKVISESDKDANLAYDSLLNILTRIYYHCFQYKLKKENSFINPV